MDNFKVDEDDHFKTLYESTTMPKTLQLRSISECIHANAWLIKTVKDKMSEHICSLTNHSC